MDALGLFHDIWSLCRHLKRGYQQVKANPAQCTTLYQRVEALGPGLRSIEAVLQAQCQRQQQPPMIYAPYPPPPQASVAPLNPTLHRQLACVLHAIEDSVHLISKFSSATWFERVWDRSDYSQAFASINAQITRAQQDLGFNLQLSELFSRQRDAQDAKADLADISRKQDQILYQMECAQAQAASIAANQQSAQRQEHRFLQSRFASMADKQSAILKFVARLEREQKQAEMRSLQPGVLLAAEAAASSALSPSSAAPSGSSVVASRDILSEVLRIPLSDLTLGPLVGSGGFGTVHKGYLRSRDEHVAVKKLRLTSLVGAAQDDFMQELRILQTLPRHAHIITLLGAVIDEESQSYMMVLEWMEQGSLFDFLRSMREAPDSAARFPMLARLRVCLQCAKAVNHLHLLHPPLGPVIHCDLKSLNILLDKHNEVKLADFGLAKLRLTSASQTSAISAVAPGASGAGTLRWSAPEFLRPGGKKSATPASDVYALGVVLWEIVTLQIPYDGDDDDTIRESIKGGPNDKLRIPPSVPAELHSLLDACWLNEPAQRPTCMDIIHALKEMIEAHEPAAAQQSQAIEGDAPPSSLRSPVAIGSSEQPAYPPPFLASTSMERAPAVAASSTQPSLDFGLQLGASSSSSSSSNNTLLPLPVVDPSAPVASPTDLFSTVPTTLAVLWSASGLLKFRQPLKAGDVVDLCTPAGWSIAEVARVETFVFGSAQLRLVNPVTKKSEQVARDSDRIWPPFTKTDISAQLRSPLPTLRIRRFPLRRGTELLVLSGDDLFVRSPSFETIELFSASNVDQDQRIKYPLRTLARMSFIHAFAVHTAKTGKKTLYLCGRNAANARLSAIDTESGREIAHVQIFQLELRFVTLDATQVYFATDGLVSIYTLDLKFVADLKLDAEYHRLRDAEKDQLAHTPLPCWIRTVAALCVFDGLLFIADRGLHRISVWSVKTLEHLFNFGRPLTTQELQSTKPEQAPPPGAFRSICSMTLHRSNAQAAPVLIIAEEACAPLLVYSLEGSFLGAFLTDMPAKLPRSCIASDRNMPGADLWETA